MSLPISFDDVPYFRNQFRGDLIVTGGVIYYFPHTNVAEEKNRKNFGPADGIDMAAPVLGAVGEVIGLLGLGKAVFDRTSGPRRRLRRPTLNRPRLSEKGLWVAGDSCEEARERLDPYVAAEKKRPPQLTGYEYSLPKPMRFAAAQVAGLRVRLGVLRFDTEFDSHDFNVGLRRRAVLLEALREAGFA
jgi:hypothetical protein